MRFMTIVKAPENTGIPPKALFDAIDALMQEQTRTGKLVTAGGLGPTARGASVRIKGRKLHVTDGPFTEAKEVIGGYAILNADSKDEAVEMAKQLMQLHIDHWPGWEGECEVREHQGP